MSSSPAARSSRPPRATPASRSPWSARPAATTSCSTMPETMSKERRVLLRAYGAELVLTPGRGHEGRRRQGRGDRRRAPGRRPGPPVRQPGQPGDPPPHHGRGDLDDTDGAVDIFVAGIGTGGTITGVGQVLKERKPEVKIVAVEPAESPILNGGAARPAQDPGHRRQLRPGDPRHRGLRRGHRRRRRDRRCEWPAAPRTRRACSSASPPAPRSPPPRRSRSARRTPARRIVVIIPTFGERYLSTDPVRGPGRLTCRMDPRGRSAAMPSREDLDAAHARDPAAGSRSRSPCLPRGARRLGVPGDAPHVARTRAAPARGAAALAAARAVTGVEIHPARDRPPAVHRPRHGRRHRRDRGRRRRRHALPRGHARRPVDARAASGTPRSATG